MSNHDDRSGLLPTDAFDVALRDLRGLPNGAHTNPRTVMNTDEYGNTTTYIVQVVKWEGGETGFVQTVSAGKPERYMLPPNVLAALWTQVESVRAQVKRRHGRRLAEAGVLKPGRGFSPEARAKAAKTRREKAAKRRARREARKE